MLVSNLIEYNHFCQIGFSSVNTVIICFISEVSLRFPFKRFFSRPALDIHPVSSLWVLLHMIPWVLSSVTCKLPLVLVIIFLRHDISCLWFYLLKHVFFSPLTWNTSWQYFIHDRWWILHEFFARQRLRFHLCHFIMTIHLICQPRHSHHDNISVVNTRWPLTIDDVSTLICFEHRFVGVEFPESFSPVWLILAVDTSS